MTDVYSVYSEGTRFFTLPSGEKVPVSNDNRIETSIVIGLEAAVDHDLEGFLDLISDMVTDTSLLTDFTYLVTGVTPEGGLILTVEGDISMIDGWNTDEMDDDSDEAWGLDNGEDM